MSAKVLVVPVLGRNWLYHAWHEAPLKAPLVPWREGKTAGKKLQLLVAHATDKARKRLNKQWHNMETAKQGTLNYRLYKLAEYVMQRVDPVETFLKALPKEASELQIRHPTSLDARLIRRRLRRLTAQREPFHRQRMYAWLAALLPQAPIVLLPIPNVTVYYTAWRIMSNRSASIGAAALAAALQRAADMQAYQLALKLQAEASKGSIELREGTWPAKLVARLDELRQRVSGADGASAGGGLAGAEAAECSTSDSTASSSAIGSATNIKAVSSETSTRNQSSGGSSSSSSGGGSNSSQSASTSTGGSTRHTKGLPAPQFIADDFLEQVVMPKQRSKVPLNETAVKRLMEHYNQPHILDHWRAASRLCLTPEQRALQRAPPDRT